METFELVHVSDLHIGTRPGIVSIVERELRREGDQARPAPASHNDVVAEELARSINSLSKQRNVDLVLVTGDVSRTGSRSDLETAYEFVDGRLPFQRPSWRANCNLGDVQVQRRILPGNHDRFRRGPAYQPGGGNFDAVFEKYWLVRHGAQIQAVLRHEAGDDSLAIVSADFSLRHIGDAVGLFGHFGQGLVDRRTLDRMIRLTIQERQRDPAVAVVWSIHFSPAFVGLDPELRLLSEQDLLTAAAAARVSVIFAGHTHKARIYTPEGFPAIQVYCSGTASEAGSAENHFYLHTLTVDSGLVTKVSSSSFIWDSLLSAFTERPNHPPSA